MCLAIPGKVKEILKKHAVIEYPGVTRNAFLSDVDVDMGDYVLVQMGIIVKKLSKDEAKVYLSVWES